MKSRALLLASLCLAGCVTTPDQVVRGSSENLLNYATGQREYAAAILSASGVDQRSPNYIFAPVFGTTHEIGDIIPSDNLLDVYTTDCRFSGEIEESSWRSIPITDDTKQIDLSVNYPDLLKKVQAGDTEINTGLFSEGIAKFGFKDLKQSLLDRLNSERLLERCETFQELSEKPDFNPTDYLLVRGFVTGREVFESGGTTRIGVGKANLVTDFDAGIGYVSTDKYVLVEETEATPKFLVLSYLPAGRNSIDPDRGGEGPDYEYDGLLRRLVPDDFVIIDR